MTDLTDLVGAYQRQVAPLGQFAANFPGASDSDVVALLADAFGSAQLDGYLGTNTYDADLTMVTPDLVPGEAALIVLYAAANTIRSKILNTATKVNYVAGPVQYEREQAASVLTQLLKGLEDQINRLAQQGVESKYARGVYQSDGYFARMEYAESLSVNGPIAWV